MHKSSFSPAAWAKNEFKLFSTLVRSLPLPVIVLFSCSVILMNLLASFTVVNLPYLALTGGVFVSWATFLFMDIVAKHFGPKAANRLSWIGLASNLVAVGIFFAISQIGAMPRFDMILHGQWSILLASTAAFVFSCILNNALNYSIGKAFKKNPDGKAAYVTRSFVSTFIGQCADNFIFGALAFIVLPMIPDALQVHWTWVQVSVCAVTCAGVELLFEIVFSPIGYRITKRWKEQNVGQEYRDLYYPQAAEGK